MAFGGGMKPGDWMCPSCGDHQFARNSECRKCGASNPGGGGCGGKGGGKGQKPGDWFCPACNDLQFAKNVQCRKCGEPNPDPEGSRSAMEAGIASRDSGDNMKPGDWFCPNCNDLNFARNSQCRKCQAPNPDPEGSMEAAQASGAHRPNPQNEHKPGDWTCSSCGDHQFARNVACRKCGAPSPQSGGGKSGGKGGGKGKGKSGMGDMMGSMMGNMMGGMGGMGGMMGGGDNGGGCGGGGMVMITQEMFAQMMGGMGGCGGGGGCQGGNMMNMMGGMGGMMGGKKGVGKFGKGGGKGHSPY